MSSKKHEGSSPDRQWPDRKGQTGAVRLVVSLVKVTVILAVVLFACGNDKDKKESQSRAGQRRPIAVVPAPVVTVELQDIVMSVGTLEAAQSVWIKPEVNGRLMSAGFEEGTFVSKDRILFELEDDKIKKRMIAQQAALASTRARLENLRRNYDRVASLRERNQISEDQYDKAGTELKAVSSDVERLVAELALTRRGLQDTVIRAPFDGFMSRRLVDPGTFVVVGEPLATIYELDRLRITFFIGEKHAGRVAGGQAVFASVAAHPETFFKGEVQFVSPVIDAGTRKFMVRADIENPDNRLMPGSFAAVRLILDTHPQRPVIPEQALIPTRDGYIVFVVDADNGTAHVRRVETGRREPGLVEITDGLVTDERVVVYGHMRLEDGSPVNVSERWDEGWPDKRRVSR